MSMRSPRSTSQSLASSPPPVKTNQAVASAQHCPSVAAAVVHEPRIWPITCPCDCMVWPLYISVCLLALLSNWTIFACNSHEFCTNYVPMNVRAGA